MTRIVGLGGGIGASRLWRALMVAHDPAACTLVVNTADDLTIYGLRVCPDLDTTLYSLSGRQDAERGWGRRDETWTAMTELRALGHDVWFNLGDRDLATHLLRTELLAAGESLTAVTARLAAAMGVACTVLPMCDEPVTTIVRTGAGRELDYERFLVREAAAPAVVATRLAGIEDVSGPAPGVLDAIAAAELVVLAPSNPIASIEPILSVPGVRAALVSAAGRTVAVSPIVSRVPISDPGEARRATSRAALLGARRLPPTATAVASLYTDVCSRFLLDTADADEASAIAALGLEVDVVDTLLHRGADAAALLDVVVGGSGRRAVDRVGSLHLE